MDVRAEKRKLPGGQRCPECDSRKYYLEDGKRFCARNGHEIPNFIQYEVGDLEDTGKAGAITRKQKEIRERERKKLTGTEGRGLYLEALQLILRSQLLWLIRDKGYREELETVVRDLWNLRIKDFGSIEPTATTEESDQLQMFSSQPDSDAEVEVKPKTNRLDWSSERGPDWPMPRMIDTLCLCYLGCLLLEAPMSLGEIFRWANGGNIPYQHMYYTLPEEMRDRLPAGFTRALKIPIHSPLRGGQLQSAALHLAYGFHHNYQLVFPALNETSALLNYSRDLALPSEPFQIANILARSLNCTFRFPLLKSKIFPVDQPEVLIPALLVVATKVCFPFSAKQQTLLPQEDDHGQRLDWQKWMSLKGDAGEEYKALYAGTQFKHVSVEQVVSTDNGQLDSYVRFMSDLIHRENNGPVTQFFPVKEVPRNDAPVPQHSEAEIEERIQEVLRAIMALPQEEDGEDEVDEAEKYDLEDDMLQAAYEAYRTSKDLSDTARKFYTVTANLAGIRLEQLTRAVYMLEQKIIRWQRRERRAEDQDVVAETEI